MMLDLKIICYINFVSAYIYIMIIKIIIYKAIISTILN